MKLILHLGAHKTGTTAIQSCLNLNSGKLILKGWELIKVDGCINLGNCVSFWKQDGDINFSVYEKKYQGLIDNLSKNNTNKIISSEDMFFVNDAAMIKRLCNDIKRIFDEIEIVTYVRNQVDMAISNKAQGAKTNQSALLFGNDYTSPLPTIDKNVYEYLDYYSKIQAWKTQLPEAKFIVREYSKQSLVNQDSVFDFIDVTGIPLEPQAINANESIGSTLTNILHGLRQAGVEPHYMRHLLRQGNFNDLGGGKQLPSKNEAKAFMLEFEASNKKLKDEFGVCLSFDIEKYPDQTTVQNASPEDIYKTIAPIINHLMFANDSQSVDAMRDAAVLIEDTAPQESYQLLKTVHALRPKGAFIKKKLAQMEAKLSSQP